MRLNSCYSSLCCKLCRSADFIVPIILLCDCRKWVAFANTVAVSSVSRIVSPFTAVSTARLKPVFGDGIGLTKASCSIYLRALVPFGFPLFFICLRFLEPVKGCFGGVSKAAALIIDCFGEGLTSVLTTPDLFFVIDMLKGETILFRICLYGSASLIIWSLRCCLWIYIPVGGSITDT